MPVAGGAAACSPRPPHAARGQLTLLAELEVRLSTLRAQAEAARASAEEARQRREQQEALAALTVSRRRAGGRWGFVRRGDHCADASGGIPVVVPVAIGTRDPAATRRHRPSPPLTCPFAAPRHPRRRRTPGLCSGTLSACASTNKYRWCVLRSRWAGCHTRAPTHCASSQSLRRLEGLHARYQRVLGEALATEAEATASRSVDLAGLGMLLVQLRDAVQEVRAPQAADASTNAVRARRRDGSCWPPPRRTQRLTKAGR